MTRTAEARVEAAGGSELLERLQRLDALSGERSVADPAVLPPDRSAKPDVDVLLVGGGLSLLLAPMLARRGLSVAVCDRGRVGAAQREWNGSDAELAALRSSGFLTDAELEALVIARYREGICRWHGGGTYPVSGVLDCAIDAGALLAHARIAAEAAGVRVLDRHELAGVGFGERSVAVRLLDRGGSQARPTTLVARAVVDARGAASAYASADILCPTVGGVLTGLAAGQAPDEMDPDVGDILVTTEGIEAGHQHIWEGFPGRNGETTVYLFYYARRNAVTPGALVRLYDRFFSTLGRYKRGDATLVRPTFGIIPGWSRLAPAPASPSPRWVLVGDAAARHSPLTFCGFGSLVRGLAGSVTRVEAAVNGRAEEPHEDGVHAGTGLLSLLLASPPAEPARRGALNALLDAAFSALHGRGDVFYGRLLRDEMSLRELVLFLRETAARRPRVYLDVVRDARPDEVLRWASLLARGVVAERVGQRGAFARSVWRA